MDLELTTEQQQVVEAFHGLLTDRCSTDLVRASESTGFDQTLWTAIVQLAGPTIGVPEELGGEEPRSSISS